MEARWALGLSDNGVLLQVGEFEASDRWVMARNGWPLGSARRFMARLVTEGYLTKRSAMRSGIRSGKRSIKRSGTWSTPISVYRLANVTVVLPAPSSVGAVVGALVGAPVGAVPGAQAGASNRSKEGKEPATTPSQALASRSKDPDLPLLSEPPADDPGDLATWLLPHVDHPDVRAELDHANTYLQTPLDIRVVVRDAYRRASRSGLDPDPWDALVYLVNDAYQRQYKTETQRNRRNGVWRMPRNAS